MKKLPHLGLGTVQFGLEYGVSNRQGRPAEREVAAILARAAEWGVGYIDTAPAYGDAEILVGRHLPRDHKMRVVTKTPALPDATIDARYEQRVLDAVAASLDRLKVGAVHALLVHQSGDLGKPGWQRLVGAMNEVKARGLAAHVGVSIYEIDQLKLVESRLAPGLVQLPFNVFDRRFSESGALARLKAAGVEVHARSAFLQGLLLMDPANLPEFFGPLREKIASLHRRWAKQGLTPVAGCLAFMFQHAELDVVVVGVNSLTELDEIIAAATAMGHVEFDPLPSVDALYLNPSRWPAFVH
jgi:aryl-alcohol dehydrogenase-like predicted oxidoreductase